MTSALVVATLLFINIHYINTELTYSGNGETKQHWNDVANQELLRAKTLKPNIAVAKNVIVFLGDGMGMSTVTAARILKGQLNHTTGEEELLSFERFPHVGLSKTYNQDAQTADSAGTATAYFCGVKTNLGIIGLDGRSRRTDCSTGPGTEIDSILDWSKAAGKSVGIVTTTRITHATPSALYAHTPERNWENDKDLKKEVSDLAACHVKDIARQLVEDNIDIDVLLGGGRQKFTPENVKDPESGKNTSGGRTDNRNLIQEWINNQTEKERSFEYVWNATGFNNVDPKNTDFLLGLFGESHMQYELDRSGDKGGEPSLEEMTHKAIQILQKNSKGYFLLVEGGRIDHAHHDSKAKKSLTETLALDLAVSNAVQMTSETDTLILTTADHSHTFTMGGYPTRGNPIFGLTDDRNGSAKIASDGKPFTTLAYANGPGGYAKNVSVLRPNPHDESIHDKEYVQHSGVPLDYETHGGEDVGIYARGPMAHLFHGVHEQHYIAHVMAYASCVGSYSADDACAMAEVNAMETNSAKNIDFSVSVIFVALLLIHSFIHDC